MNHTQAALLLKYKLTPRQIDVAMLVAQRLTNKEIGSSLNITEKCVKWHLGAVYSKCDIEGRRDLMDIIDRLCK